MTATNPVEQPDRSRVRWWHVLVLVAGVLVVAGALVFMSSASSDRDEAAAVHRRRAHALADARVEVRRAQTELVDAHTEAGNVRNKIDEFVTSAQEVMTIADQLASEAGTTQRLGADATVPTGDYNASVARNNALADQYGPKIDRFRTLAGQLLGVGTQKAQNTRVERRAR
jgi:hypothetical protein